MRTVDHLALRVYATETEAPANLDELVEKTLFNRPGLVLGQEIVLGNGTTVRVDELLCVNDDSTVSVLAAALPMDKHVSYALTHDPARALMGAPACATCAATHVLRPCGNQCGTLYCSRVCQHMDWEAGHSKQCL